MFEVADLKCEAVSLCGDCNTYISSDRSARLLSTDLCNNRFVAHTEYLEAEALLLNEEATPRSQLAKFLPALYWSAYMRQWVISHASWQHFSGSYGSNVEPLDAFSKVALSVQSYLAAGFGRRLLNIVGSRLQCCVQLLTCSYSYTGVSEALASVTIALMRRTRCAGPPLVKDACSVPRRFRPHVRRDCRQPTTDDPIWVSIVATHFWEVAEPDEKAEGTVHDFGLNAAVL